MLTSLGNANTTSVQASFVALLPRIESQARIYFRGIECSVKKADYVAEVVAICWRWFCRLAKKGKDATQFVGALAAFAARAVWGGRRTCGQVSGNDVMSAVAQRRYNFKVETLPTAMRESHESHYGAVNGQRMHDVFEERLQDNLMTPPPDQAAFRIDFNAWLKTLTPRERQVIRAMAMSERTKDLSRRFAVSTGRISQMRREFHDGWSRFVGDIEDKMTA